VVRYGLRPDSGGAGTFRGGGGAIYEIELLEQSAEAFIFGERGKHAPKGVCGGKPAAMNRFSYQNGKKWHTPPMVSKMVGIRLKRGERVRIESPGGGGYGKPGDRTSEAIAADIELGYVSTAAAKRDYPRAARAKVKPAKRARAAKAVRRAP